MEEKVREIAGRNEPKLVPDSKYLALLLVPVLIVSSFLLFDDLDLRDNKVEADAEVVIAQSVMPYSTVVNSSSLVRFTNRQEQAVNVSFQTYQIDRTLRLKVNESGVLNLSKYSNLPEDNYFSAGGEDGRIVVR